MKRVLLLLSDGFEELEAVAPLDLLRRAGIETVSAAVGGGLEVTGGRGIVIRADRKLEDCLREPFDLLYVPGGPGVDALRKNPVVRELVRRYRSEGLPIAAICAAPLVLLDAQVLAGRRVTSFPSAAEELKGSVGAYSEDRIVLDDGILTSRGAGSAEEFSLKLIEFLVGAAAAEDVRSRIVAR